MGNNTMKFEVPKNEKERCREVVRFVYGALQEKGYDPINQFIGYLLSGDPTYITTYNNARQAIRKVERDELLAELLKEYIAKMDS